MAAMFWCPHNLTCFELFSARTPGFLRGGGSVDSCRRNAKTHLTFSFPFQRSTRSHHSRFHFSPPGSRAIPGGGPGDAPRVLQRHRGWKGRGPVLEKGHLQSDLQTGQRSSRGLQIPQLPTRAPARLTRPREETKQARQTSTDCEKTVGTRLAGGL